MYPAFIQIRFIDVIDILVVAYLIYQLYYWMRGTIAMQIFITILSIYILWLVIKALNMELLGSILGQVIGVGVLAIIILFQQEIRRFLAVIGTRYVSSNTGFFSLDKFLSVETEDLPDVQIGSIVKACSHMAESRTGALIVIKRKSNLDAFINTGDIINADTTSRMLRSIFSRLSPLHDGAVIIINDKIFAARCVLPVSNNPNLPPHFGMRHRAAMGLAEDTDAMAIVVSEESGRISIAAEGRIKEDIDTTKLRQILEKEFIKSA
ncbi:MAG: TIGR00159 family protein [Bacteroidetes bacterium]|jgi:uncharacterized protein (TIGR00159 family)|nr:TIGR00159 family protein [Bacteroidota bacterium]